MTTDSQRPDRRPTTLIVGQAVKPGHEAEFGAWLTQMHSSAARFAGCLGAKSIPPSGDQAAWTCIYRFDSSADLRAWMNSSERGDLVRQLQAVAAAPPIQQIIPGDAEGESDELVTVVVTHRVPADSEAEFRQWQTRMTEAEKKYDGFIGAELFEPIPEVQDEWTAVYRFESGEALEGWLQSPERAQLLNEGKNFQDFHLRAIQTAFGSWFARAGRVDAGPGPFRTSIAVLVGLYPTVVLLTLGIAWLFPDGALWQTLLLGNVISAFVMTLVTMPYYVNPMLKFWLTAGDEAPQPKTTLKGIGISIATLAVWALLFWLITAKFWTPP